MSDQEYSDSSTGNGNEAEGAAGSESAAEASPATEAAPPPPPPPAGDAGSGSGSDNKGIMLVLSYLWILALIPLLVDKDSEVQWHAKNGLVWTVAEFLMHVVLTVLGMATAFVGCFVGPVLMLAWLVVRVMAIMKALKGERMTLPVLSDFVEKF